MSKILEQLAKIEQAKLKQRSLMANERLADYVGQELVLTGMFLTEDVEIDSLVMDKVTYTTRDGKAIDAFYAMATEQARELIDILGSGPYTPPLVVEVCSKMTKVNTKTPKEIFYVELRGYYDPDGKFAQMAAEAALDEQLFGSDNQDSPSYSERESFGEMTPQERSESNS